MSKPILENLNHIKTKTIKTKSFGFGACLFSSDIHPILILFRDSWRKSTVLSPMHPLEFRQLAKVHCTFANTPRDFRHWRMSCWRKSYWRTSRHPRKRGFDYRGKLGYFIFFFLRSTGSRDCVWTSRCVEKRMIWKTTQGIKKWKKWHILWWNGHNNACISFSLMKIKILNNLMSWSWFSIIFILMTLIRNQNRDMRLVRILIFINENEIHALLSPFHHKKCHFFHFFHIKVTIFCHFFIPWEAWRKLFDSVEGLKISCKCDLVFKVSFETNANTITNFDNL